MWEARLWLSWSSPIMRRPGMVGCEPHLNIRLRGAGATERLHELVDLRHVPGILRGIRGRVVQILQQTGELCEEAVRFLLVGEWVVSLNKPAHQCKSLLLAIQGHRDILCVPKTSSVLI